MKKRAYFVGLLVMLAPASASAVDIVRSPLVHEGDYSVDYKGKYQTDGNARQDNTQEHDFGFGYAPTSRWRTRIESEFIDTPSQGINLKYVGWANTYSLTGNDAPWPTAIFVNTVFANHSYIANYVTAGVAVQKQLGPTTNLANLFLKHEFGNEASGKPSVLYRLQSKYNIYSYLSPGMELFGDTAKQDQTGYKNESLKLGPGIFGIVPLGKQHMHYELVYLLGATTASADNTIKWRVSYTFN